LGISLLLLSFLVLKRMLQQRQTASGVTASKHKPCLQLNYGVGLLLTWLLGPPLAGLIASVTLQPLFISRYLLAALPVWLLLASIGITLLAGRVGAAVVAFSMASLATFGLLIGPGKRQDWRAVAEFFVQKKQVGDCVLIYPGWMVTPFGYYYRGQIPCLDLPTDPNLVNRSTSLATRVWLILANATPSNGKLLVDTLLAVSKNHHQEILLTSLMETHGHGGDVKVFIVSRK